MVNEADILSQLNLGTSKAVLESQPNSPLVALMNRLAQDVVDRLRVSIDKKDISASNNLKQSITPVDAVMKGGAVEVAIQADFYWKFVEYGVNGTQVNYGAPAWGSQPSTGKSFHDSILEWIPHRSVGLPEQFQTFDQLAWAIQANIKKKGKAPRPFFTDVVNEKLMAELRKPVEAFLKRTIEIRILEPWQ